MPPLSMLRSYLQTGFFAIPNFFTHVSIPDTCRHWSSPIAGGRGYFRGRMSRLANTCKAGSYIWQKFQLFSPRRRRPPFAGPATPEVPEVPEVVSPYAQFTSSLLIWVLRSDLRVGSRNLRILRNLRLRGGKVPEWHDFGLFWFARGGKQPQDPQDSRISLRRIRRPAPFERRSVVHNRVSTELRAIPSSTIASQPS